MALQDILIKIRADGEADVQAIEAARDADLAAITNLNDNLVTERIKIGDEDASRRASKVAERILSKARHQVQIIAGNVEQKKLEAVFSAIATELSSLDQKSYEAFLTDQFSKLKLTDNGSFVVAKSRGPATTAFLAANGIRPDSIKSESDNSLLGGFVYATDKQEFDCSFRGLLQNIRHRHAVEIAGKLIS